MPTGPAQAKFFFSLLILALIMLSAVMPFIRIYRMSSALLLPAPQLVTSPTSSSGAVSSVQPAGGIGGAIYDNASNPVNGKLPDVAAPVPNPIGSAYKNPFE